MNLQEEFLLMSFNAINDSHVVVGKFVLPQPQGLIEDFDLTEDYYPEHTSWWEEEGFDVIETYNVSDQQLAEFDWEDE
tara:strand:- start:68 stop:301 length:234 start_codon:yes stop_codon:yes gene_type:complete